MELFNIDSLADIEVEKMNKYVYPDAHRDIYKTGGGTPHLDGGYTVFGEVIMGFEVIDAISEVETRRGDRPIVEVKMTIEITE